MSGAEDDDAASTTTSTTTNEDEDFDVEVMHLARVGDMVLRDLVAACYGHLGDPIGLQWALVAVAARWEATLLASYGGEEGEEQVLAAVAGGAVTQDEASRLVKDIYIVALRNIGTLVSSPLSDSDEYSIAQEGEVEVWEEWEEEEEAGEGPVERELRRRKFLDQARLEHSLRFCIKLAREGYIDCATAVSFAGLDHPTPAELFSLALVTDAEVQKVATKSIYEAESVFSYFEFFDPPTAHNVGTDDNGGDGGDAVPALSEEDYLRELLRLGMNSRVEVMTCGLVRKLWNVIQRVKGSRSEAEEWFMDVALEVLSSEMGRASGDVKATVCRILTQMIRSSDDQPARMEQICRQLLEANLPHQVEGVLFPLAGARETCNQLREEVVTAAMRLKDYETASTLAKLVVDNARWLPRESTKGIPQRMAEIGLAIADAGAFEPACGLLSEVVRKWEDLEPMGRWTGAVELTEYILARVAERGTKVKGGEGPARILVDGLLFADVLTQELREVLLDYVYRFLDAGFSRGSQVVFNIDMEGWKLEEPSAEAVSRDVAAKLIEANEMNGAFWVITRTLKRNGDGSPKSEKEAALAEARRLMATNEQTGRNGGGQMPAWIIEYACDLGRPVGVPLQEQAAELRQRYIEFAEEAFAAGDVATSARLYGRALGENMTGEMTEVERLAELEVQAQRHMVANKESVACTFLWVAAAEAATLSAAEATARYVDYGCRALAADCFESARCLHEFAVDRRLPPARRLEYRGDSVCSIPKDTALGLMFAYDAKGRLHAAHRMVSVWCVGLVAGSVASTGWRGLDVLRSGRLTAAANILEAVHTVCTATSTATATAPLITAAASSAAAAAAEAEAASTAAATLTAQNSTLAIERSVPVAVMDASAGSSGELECVKGGESRESGSSDNNNGGSGGGLAGGDGGDGGDGAAGRAVEDRDGAVSTAPVSNGNNASNTENNFSNSVSGPASYSNEPLAVAAEMRAAAAELSGEGNVGMAAVLDVAAAALELDPCEGAAQAAECGALAERFGAAGLAGLEAGDVSVAVVYRWAQFHFWRRSLPADVCEEVDWFRRNHTPDTEVRAGLPRSVLVQFHACVVGMIDVFKAAKNELLVDSNTELGGHIARAIERYGDDE